MRRNGFLCDKRAITPVLSNLLLTVVAVAAMAIATTATYVITTNLKENMSERILIEDVWFKSSGGVSIYVRNIGKISIHISAVYINHVNQTFIFQATLELGKHEWLDVPSYKWASGYVYYLDLVTSRGNHVGGSYKAI